MEVLTFKVEFEADCEADFIEGTFTLHKSKCLFENLKRAPMGGKSRKIPEISGNFLWDLVGGFPENPGKFRKMKIFSSNSFWFLFTPLKVDKWVKVDV